MMRLGMVGNTTRAEYFLRFAPGFPTTFYIDRMNLNPNTLALFDVSLRGVQPKQNEGYKAMVISVDLTTDPEVFIDLTGLSAYQNKFSTLKTIFISYPLAAGGGAFQVGFSTGQIIHPKCGTEGYYRVISTQPHSLRFRCDPNGLLFLPVQVLALNFELDQYVIQI